MRLIITNRFIPIHQLLCSGLACHNLQKKGAAPNHAAQAKDATMSIQLTKFYFPDEFAIFGRYYILVVLIVAVKFYPIIRISIFEV